jgi:hypothetical protein
VTKGTRQALHLLLLCAPAAAGGAAIESLGPGTGAQAAYEDRLIDGGNLPVEVSSDEYAGHNAAGWPRALYVEAIASEITRDGADMNETGFQFGGMLDTPDYGAITFDATLRTSGSSGEGSGNLFTLVQRGLPMNGGWFMNNAAGVVNTPTGDLARRQYRFFVPTIQMNGTAMEWRKGNELQAFATYGQPGMYTGIYIPTFEGLGGRQAGGGLQWNFADQWSAAAQMVDVQNVGTGLYDTSGKISGQSWFGAVAWGSPEARAQLNLVESSSRGGSSNSGAWVDAAVRSGRISHTFGGFYLDPDLAWGNQQLASDSAGGYYRAAFQNRRWTIDGGIDYMDSVSGSGDSVIYGTGYARYQYSSGLGIGGGANIRQSGSEAWSVFGFADVANRWGIGRGQANYAQDERQDYAQITLDQTWKTQVGRRLSTTIMAGRENLEAYSANTVGLALYGGGDLGHNLTVDVNARWDKAFGEASSDNTLANAAINWAFASGWTASANYYKNRVSGRVPLTVDSPLPDADVFDQLSSDDSGLYVSVRYDWRAGSPSAPLGGLPGRGSGSVIGVLFLDENDNGRRDAGEAGAANVVVLLDGRFAARTDADGRFIFPAVVAGEHFLVVMPDNLPLAWSIPTDARMNLQVGVRDQARVELPVRRQR